MPQRWGTLWSRPTWRNTATRCQPRLGPSVHMALLNCAMRKQRHSFSRFSSLLARSSVATQPWAWDSILLHLKQDFELGHGHAMAICALLKGSKSEDSE